MDKVPVIEDEAFKLLDNYEVSIQAYEVTYEDIIKYAEEL